MSMHFEDCGDGIYTGISAIYRWYPSLVSRPGTYRVIATEGAYHYLKLVDPEHKLHEWHPTCVVDDFGDLQKVPA